MATKPTIVMVPGAWELPTTFKPLEDLLEKSGYDSKCVHLPSTGGTTLPLTGLAEDVAAILAELRLAVDSGKEVILLTHSAGGVSGSQALRGLDIKTRREAGLPGGVVRIIYMAAFMVPKGQSLMAMLGGKPTEWMVVEDDRVTPNAEMVPDLVFSDLSPDERKKWMLEISHTSAALFTGVAEFEPWNEGIPCGYIFTKLDGALPYALQEKMATQMGPNGRTVTLDANHNPFLSMPEAVVRAIEEISAP